jgi:hypothetical protein
MSLLPSSIASMPGYPASLAVSQPHLSHHAAALALSNAHSATLLAASSTKRKSLGFSIDSIVGAARQENGGYSGDDNDRHSPPASRSRSVSPPVDVSSSVSPPPLSLLNHHHRMMMQAAAAAGNTSGDDRSPPPPPHAPRSPLSGGSDHNRSLPSPVNLSSSRLHHEALNGGGESPPTSPGIRMPPSSAFPPTSLPGGGAANLSYLDRLASLKALYDSTTKMGEAAAAAAAGGLPPGFPGLPGSPFNLPHGLPPAMLAGLPPRLPGLPGLPDMRGQMIPPPREYPLYPWFINRHRFPGGEFFSGILSRVYKVLLFLDHFIILLFDLIYT